MVLKEVVACVEKWSVRYRMEAGLRCIVPGVTSNRTGINCGQPLIAVSATAFICSSCRMVEFGPTNQVQQQQQPQEPEKGEKQ